MTRAVNLTWPSSRLACLGFFFIVAGAALSRHNDAVQSVRQSTLAERTGSCQAENKKAKVKKCGAAIARERAQKTQNTGQNRCAPEKRPLTHSQPRIYNLICYANRRIEILLLLLVSRVSKPIDPNGRLGTFEAFCPLEFQSFFFLRRRHLVAVQFGIYISQPGS